MNRQIALIDEARHLQTSTVTSKQETQRKTEDFCQLSSGQWQAMCGQSILFPFIDNCSSPFLSGTSQKCLFYWNFIISNIIVCICTWVQGSKSFVYIGLCRALQMEANGSQPSALPSSSTQFVRTKRERERATRNETICCAKLPIGRQATACQIMQRHQSSVSTFAFDIEALRQRKVMKSWLSVVVVVVGACVESCSECYASVIVSRQIFSFVLSFWFANLSTPIPRWLRGASSTRAPLHHVYL